MWGTCCASNFLCGLSRNMCKVSHRTFDVRHGSNIVEHVSEVYVIWCAVYAKGSRWPAWRPEHISSPGVRVLFLPLRRICPPTRHHMLHLVGCVLVGMHVEKVSFLHISKVDCSKYKALLWCVCWLCFFCIISSDCFFLLIIFFWGGVSRFFFKCCSQPVACLLVSPLHDFSNLVAKKVAAKAAEARVARSGLRRSPPLQPSPLHTQWYIWIYKNNNKNHEANAT